MKVKSSEFTQSFITLGPGHKDITLAPDHSAHKPRLLAGAMSNKNWPPKKRISQTTIWPFKAYLCPVGMLNNWTMIELSGKGIKTELRLPFKHALYKFHQYSTLYQIEKNRDVSVL